MAVFWEIAGMARSALDAANESAAALDAHTEAGDEKAKIEEAITLSLALAQVDVYIAVLSLLEKNGYAGEEMSEWASKINFDALLNERRIYEN
jgi:hypothetical protein